MSYLGYLVGIEKDFPTQQLSTLPYRKKRCIESHKKINFNLQHAKKRIVIEHTICRLKKYRIMNDVSRKQIKKIQQGIRYSIRTD